MRAEGPVPLDEFYLITKRRRGSVEKFSHVIHNNISQKKFFVNVHTFRGL